MTYGGGPDPSQVKEEISREVARVHLDSYGEAPQRVRVALHEDFIAVVMEVSLSQAEETLVEAGDAETVRETRGAFQDVIGSTFVAIVERATGRRVDAFVSDTVLDGGPPWSVEVFRLSEDGAPA